jgi:energy-converting hydrogenase Eha subunit B
MDQRHAVPPERRSPHRGLRAVTSIIVGVATFYIMYWFPFAMMEMPVALSLGLSLAVAILAGRLVWNSGGGINYEAMRSMLRWALILGGIGFAAGFFGPIILTPDANQGPLLGIFITGPLGFVLGGIVGLVLWLRRRHPVSID